MTATAPVGGGVEAPSSANTRGVRYDFGALGAGTSGHKLIHSTIN